MGWRHVLAAWPLVESDMHEVYGIDITHLDGRTGRWLRVRIEGLLSTDSRLSRHVRSLEV